MDFIDAAILAISKKALINGGGGRVSPVVRFPLPFSSGFEFTVFPAYTPPGCGPLLANGGTQFFVSSHFVTTHRAHIGDLGIDKYEVAQFPYAGLEFERGSGQHAALPFSRTSSGTEARFSSARRFTGRTGGKVGPWGFSRHLRHLLLRPPLGDAHFGNAGWPRRKANGS